MLMERLLTLLTSCDERRYEQWENQAWWEFIAAEQRSKAFQKWLGEGLTRTLVAARGREISARTGGLILAQIVFDLARAGGRADRVLDAPTNEAWIDPWVAAAEPPRRRPAASASRWRGPGCATAHLGRHGTASGTVAADYYVAALPVEVMRRSPGRRCARSTRLRPASTGSSRAG